MPLRGGTAPGQQQVGVTRRRRFGHLPWRFEMKASTPVRMVEFSVFKEPPLRELWLCVYVSVVSCRLMFRARPLDPTVRFEHGIVTNSGDVTGLSAGELFEFFKHRCWVLPICE